jgi:predicted HD superfamily hydrolase involved in NAD metabolism
MSFDDYKAVIRPLLGDKRYYHSICVARAAKELAGQCGADKQKAETAGILHDIMKDIPSEKQLEMMNQYGIKLSPVERSAQKLWHAMLGSAYLKNELHIDDPEILDAVRYHTTGRENMTTMDKVLFVADFISADRNYPGVENLRKAAKIGLNEAVMEGLSYTIADLAQNRKAIHPDTIAAFNQEALAFAGDKS